MHYFAGAEYYQGFADLDYETFQQGWVISQCLVEALIIYLK